MDNLNSNANRGKRRHNYIKVAGYVPCARTVCLRLCWLSIPTRTCIVYLASTNVNTPYAHTTRSQLPRYVVAYLDWHCYSNYPWVLQRCLTTDPAIDETLR